jgi:NhaP-type Na+/H+ or K+/H+ antiporter
MSISLMIAVIVLGGWALGRIFQKLKVPGILGMPLWGLSVRIIWSQKIPSSLWEITPFFSSLALIVILLRAGLGINRKMLRQTGVTAILLGFIPCLIEAGGLVLALYYIMGFPLAI